MKPMFPSKPKSYTESLEIGRQRRHVIDCIIAKEGLNFTCSSNVVETKKIPAKGWNSAKSRSTLCGTGMTRFIGASGKRMLCVEYCPIPFHGWRRAPSYIRHNPPSEFADDVDGLRAYLSERVLLIVFLKADEDGPDPIARFAVIPFSKIDKDRWTRPDTKDTRIVFRFTYDELMNMTRPYRQGNVEESISTALLKYMK